ncbi:MAG: thioesterase, partial [Alishewanella sp. 32-51-5]
HGDLRPLAQGKRVKQQITVQLFAEGELCAEFSGLYAVLPE